MVFMRALMCHQDGDGIGGWTGIELQTAGIEELDRVRVPTLIFDLFSSAS